MVVFLLVTLSLSLWLGYQALDAAGSHRRTAEAVMADYAGIAAWEYSRFVRENLDSFYRRVFDDIPWTLRRRAPSPDVMANDLRSVLRSQRCECRGLRTRAWLFRVDLGNGSAHSTPDTLDPEVLNRLGKAILDHRQAEPESRIGLLTLDAGEIMDPVGLLMYLVSVDQDGSDQLAYGVVADAEAFQELFLQWYRQAPLLPAIIAGAEPVDSLLQVTVTGPTGLPVFASPVRYPRTYASTDTLESEYGSLVVEAAIRPDAAPHLIIGGLPRSRIPLFMGLMLLTLGVGAAAFIQLRREHQLARLRDDFISGVSHEFRTPLTQIRIFAELLDSEKLRSPQERKRSTSVINREATRLTHLVENILQFARSSRLPTSLGDLEEIDLSEAFQELAEAFGPQASAAESRIDMNVAPGVSVMAGRGGMYRILANLLDNALKYGPAGQTVEVRAQAHGERIRISVGDKGPGVPRRDRERIWEPYRRLGRDLSGDVQGSGIGLAVVKELSKAYGGEAWVEDREGGGARFVVELPGVSWMDETLISAQAGGPAPAQKDASTPADTDAAAPAKAPAPAHEDRE
jgi:signal transduction histidine kinase